MRRVLFPALALCLAAGAASAQYPGGGGGRGHGGGRGGHGGSPGAQGPKSPPPQAEKPANEVDIVGVVKAIDVGAGRITIAYEPVEALNWPAGTLPFTVAKSAMLQQARVGEKVRFRIESQAIVSLAPWTAKPGPAEGADREAGAHQWRGPRSGGPGGPPPGGSPAGGPPSP